MESIGWGVGCGALTNGSGLLTGSLVGVVLSTYGRLAIGCIGRLWIGGVTPSIERCLERGGRPESGRFGCSPFGCIILTVYVYFYLV